MGLGLFRCSTLGESSYCSAKKKKWSCPLQPNESFPAAPNPIRFNILRTRVVYDHVVAEINYPDCNNYEGNKICLFLYTKVEDLMQRKEIDPHFAEDLNSPFARFKPTQSGWNTAIELAEILYKKDKGGK